MKKTTGLRRIGLVVVILTGLILSLGCSSREIQPGNESITAEELKRQARDILEKDDYREFEKAEFRLLALRFWNRQDVEIGGLLAQLYVAWTEQIKNEIDFLRLRLAAYGSNRSKQDIDALSALIDYRITKLNEVEEWARTLCIALVTYFPEQHPTRRVMADYYRIMGDREMMDFNLQRAKEIKPDSEGVAFIEAAALMEFDKDYITAVMKLKTLVAKAPKFVKAHFFLGLAYHRSGNLEDAVKTMKEVLVKSPNHPGAKAYLDADTYLSKLKTEAKALVMQAPSAPAKKDSKLLIVQGRWAGNRPSVYYRLAAPTERDLTLHVAASLIEDGDRVIDVVESDKPLVKNSFASEELHFAKAVIKNGASYEVLIQFSEKMPDDSFRSILIQKAPMP